MENNNDHANFCIYKKCYNVGCIDMVYNIPDYIKVSILNSSNNNDVHEFSSLIDTNNHEQRIYYLYTFTYNKLICEFRITATEYWISNKSDILNYDIIFSILHPITHPYNCSHNFDSVNYLRELNNNIIYNIRNVNDYATFIPTKGW